MSNETSRSGQLLRIVIPLLILGAGVAAFLGMYKLRSKPAGAAVQPQPAEVRTIPVARHDEGLEIEVDGLVVPFREVVVSAEVSGRVAQKTEYCEAGTYVTPGTPLIGIDPRNYQLEVARLEKELEQSRVALSELDEQVQGTEQLLKLAAQEVVLLQRELARQKQLTNVVTPSDVEKAERNELVARNAELSLGNERRLLLTRRPRLESAVSLVEAQLERAQLDLQRTDIVAPFRGVVVREMVEQGAYVKEGTELFALEDTSKVEVQCNLRMEDLSWIWNQAGSVAAPRLGTEAEMGYKIPDVGPVEVIYHLPGQEHVRYVWSGRLARFDGIGLDEKTRTVPCRIEVQDPRQSTLRVIGDGQQRAALRGPPALLRGMFVTVRLRVHPKSELLRVPEEAVHPGNVVWRVDQGVLTIEPVRFVKLVPRPREQVAETNLPNVARLGDEDRLYDVLIQPLSNLAENDAVVTSKLAYVRSGMEVQTPNGPAQNGPRSEAP